jgi:hypothetical protein
MSAFFWVGRQMHMIENASISYRDALQVVCIPRGSIWSITLSDQPNLRQPTPSGAFGDGDGFKPVPSWWQSPADRQPVMIERA